MRTERHQTHALLAPVPGSERQLHSFHYGPEQPQGKVYIQAALHADELPGMLVAWHLKQRLTELEIEVKALEMTLFRVVSEERDQPHGKPNPATSILKSEPSAVSASKGFALVSSS